MRVDHTASDQWQISANEEPPADHDCQLVFAVLAQACVAAGTIADPVVEEIAHQLEQALAIPGSPSLIPAFRLNEVARTGERYFIDRLMGDIGKRQGFQQALNRLAGKLK